MSQVLFIVDDTLWKSNAPVPVRVESIARLVKDAETLEAFRSCTCYLNLGSSPI